MREIARARPLLGTVVAIRLSGLPAVAAAAAVEQAFAEIAAIQRCMSFHDRASDLSRLHRASGSPVAVDPRTHDVLAQAIVVADESGGLFDPGIAARLVEWGLLPAPDGAPRVDPAASWRDIELLGDSHVRLRRPLWIDLGGIAKGFAVDRALAILRASGARGASVNAGGDLARFGPRAETVVLDPGVDGARAAVELGDRALATSSGRPLASRRGNTWRSAHVHGRSRRAMGTRRGVSVAAASCCLADALTKVVMADLRAGERLLRRHRAVGWVFDASHGWRELGAS